MESPPEEISGARVICYTPIDDRHDPTGSCRHVVGGQLMGAFAGLAIAQYPGEDAFYLLYCDEHWDDVTDTWHQSLEEAKARAEAEYAGVTQTWITNT